MICWPNNLSGCLWHGHRPHLFEYLFSVKAKEFGIVTQIAARLHRRWHDGKIICFQCLQILDANTDGFENFFKCEALFLTLGFESLTDSLRHDKRSDSVEKRNI